ncbi:MarR family transcriptional regulator [Skermanella stibiiresistens SB22]|uniref:MarR family transcriptional regulator n=1 Tax=Skermanella stibiiresistens SB22 TaxID=1385369 RepID=W9H339_9PROT|nr:MarR family transcriptional regulator [Skermanella stibiiresistens]EWY38168.1 MarR family transcriptional regulator [Skermanella stibiiresistens SB22]
MTESRVTEPRHPENTLAGTGATEAGDNPLLLANQICFALYSATHAMTKAYRPLLDDLGVTYPQYLVLLLLWERDGRSVKELGEHLSLDSGTLTPLLKRLEGQGLVSRSRDRADERSVLIHLTVQGKALHDKAECLPARITEASGCSTADLAGLRDQILRLRNDLTAALRKT